MHIACYCSWIDSVEIQMSILWPIVEISRISIIPIALCMVDFYAFLAEFVGCFVTHENITITAIFVSRESKNVEIGISNITWLDNVSSCLRLITNYMKSDSVVSCSFYICKLVV